MSIDIDQLEDRARVLNELGAFPSDEAARHVLALIREARMAEAASNGTQAIFVAGLAEQAANAAIASRHWMWRAIYYHQIHIYLFHFAVIVGILNIGSGRFQFIAKEVWTIPVAVMGFGALGAELRSIWFLHRQVARQIFRRHFMLAHLCAPWIGALFGLFVYLLLWAGLLTLEGGANVDLSSSAMPSGLAFLAGYSWEWVLGRLDALKSTSRPEPTDEGGHKPAAAQPPADTDGQRK